MPNALDACSGLALASPAPPASRWQSLATCGAPCPSCSPPASRWHSLATCGARAAYWGNWSCRGVGGGGSTQW
eukprot:2607932-Pyramimonas_sp.AAC.1